LTAKPIRFIKTL